MEATGSQLGEMLYILKHLENVFSSPLPLLFLFQFFFQDQMLLVLDRSKVRVCSVSLSFRYLCRLLQAVSVITMPSAAALTQSDSRPQAGQVEECVKTVCTTPLDQTVSAVSPTTIPTQKAAWTELMPASVSLQDALPLLLHLPK